MNETKQEHWIGDGCSVYHGKMPESIPLHYIKAQFQESLMLRDNGIPQDYGATRYGPTKSALDAKIWLERNSFQVIATLMGYIEESNEDR